ncbi:TetR/AcrR family transcriptional regulator [Streptomyces sp. NPDC058653]|uniref:TetR/AcrR family transcriptional regulator n=1 Tax=Streptomyces sp. NPDC058653 TaxID=3346576 RepID=UPI00365E26A0
MGTTGADAPPARGAARPRNRRGEGGRLRTEILAAATRLLDRGDQRACTLRAVAREAGIAASSIYPHFPDRSAIVLAVAREAFAELSGRLRTAVDGAGPGFGPGPGPGPGFGSGSGFDLGSGFGCGFGGQAGEATPRNAEQRLYAACFAYLDYAAAHPERYRVMFGDLPDAGTPLSLTETLTEAIAHCVTAGRSTSTDPRTDAVALWLGLHGLAHQRAIAHAFPWPADLVRPFVASLSRIGPPAGRAPS